MYKKFMSPIYVINIISQAIFTLIIPPGAFFFLNYLCVANFDVPKWSYAISLSLGFIIGLYSMVRFVIAASEGLERLEKQQDKEGVT